MIEILNRAACLDPLLTAQGVTKGSDIRSLATLCAHQLAISVQPDKASQSKWCNERVPGPRCVTNEAENVVKIRKGSQLRVSAP